MGETTGLFLRSCTKWVADYYDENGLDCGPHASPGEEVLYLLGPPFENLQLRRRPESYIGSTILDLACVLEQGEIYDVARNEFLAVDIVLPVVETDDNQGQYCLDVGGHRFEPNMPYQEYWQPASSWRHAPHHQREAENLPRSRSVDQRLAVLPPFKRGSSEPDVAGPRARFLVRVRVFGRGGCPWGRQLASTCPRSLGVVFRSRRSAAWRWRVNTLAWAQGTYEYRPMGAAVISKSDLFRRRDFSPRRPPRPRARPASPGSSPAWGI